MKKAVFFVLFLAAAVMGQVEYTVSKLKVEKAVNNNSGLYVFYRHIYSEQTGETVTNYSNVYRKNLTTGQDIFISESKSVYSKNNLISIDEISFIGLQSDNPEDVIFAGNVKRDADGAFIRTNSFLRFYPGVTLQSFIESKKTPGKYYAVFDGKFRVSTDYGISFTDLAPEYIPAGISPYDDNEVYAVKDGKLYKSEDGGLNFALVFNAGYKENEKVKIIFTQDPAVIYAERGVPGQETVIDVSQDGGAAGSWKTIGKTGHSNTFILPLQLSADSVYFAARMNFYKVSNKYYTEFMFPASVKDFREFITGLAVVSGTGKVVISTRDKIYCGKGSEFSVIKENMRVKNPPDFYPLHNGDIRVYRYTNKSYSNPANNQELIVKIRTYGDTLIPGKGRYFIMDSDYLTTSQKFVREDSSGKIYQLTGSGNDLTKYKDVLLLNQFANQGEFDLPDAGSSGFSQQNVTFLCAGYFMNRYTVIKKWNSRSYQDEFIDFVKDIGIVRETRYYDFGKMEAALLAAFVSGTVYGDPSLLEGENVTDAAPESFNLKGNYPNPFNPQTRIAFSLGSGMFIALRVYDVLGNEVRTLVNEYRNAGIYSELFDASDLSSGIYFYRLESRSGAVTGKMILLQ
ncbi:MAG: T9SS type A sorting domain-containing protein [Ignavibacteriaceae bacterium]|nr:T9SS type A sorting domain-containing protein [Ignavibacteriaceae bacterium]